MSHVTKALQHSGYLRDSCSSLSAAVFTAVCSLAVKATGCIGSKRQALQAESGQWKNIAASSLASFWLPEPGAPSSCTLPTDLDTADAAPGWSSHLKYTQSSFMNRNVSI